MAVRFRSCRQAETRHRGRMASPFRPSGKGTCEDGGVLFAHALHNAPALAVTLFWTNDVPRDTPSGRRCTTIVRYVFGVIYFDSAPCSGIRKNSDPGESEFLRIPLQGALWYYLKVPSRVITPILPSASPRRT